MMAKKKSKTGATLDSTENADGRFKSSPYHDRFCSLTFENNEKLSVHFDILCKYPSLYSLYQIGSKFPEISPDVGHILVHFLYTGRYESLASGDKPPTEKKEAELATAVRVYVASQKYLLSRLTELAKEEIGRLGDEVTFLRMLDIIEEGYPRPSQEDSWFTTYLTSKVQLFCESLTNATATQHLSTLGNASSIPQILLRSMITQRTQALGDGADKNNGLSETPDTEETRRHESDLYSRREQEDCEREGSWEDLSFSRR